MSILRQHGSELPQIRVVPLNPITATRLQRLLQRVFFQTRRFFNRPIQQTATLGQDAFCELGAPSAGQTFFATVRFDPFGTEKLLWSRRGHFATLPAPVKGGRRWNDGRLIQNLAKDKESMEAPVLRVAILLASLSSVAASYRTANFIVTAPSSRLAQQIGDQAEVFRRELALEWLGKQLPRWSSPCPISAQVAPHLGAGGATSFIFQDGQVGGWRMNIQGSEIRILDSVLPHEVTHTIFATHFRQPLPRWADEGACTTVEHTSEKARHEKMLVTFLQTRRGISFSHMFAMKEYPSDVLPLYAQGYSLARYLIEEKGRRQFVAFIGDGLSDENWLRALDAAYGVDNLALLQDSWLNWVKQGSPPRQASPPVAGNPFVVLASNVRRTRPKPNLIHRIGNVPSENVKPPAGPPRNSPKTGPRLARDGWYAAGERPATESLSFAPGSIGSTLRRERHQATRQQPLQQPKQTILR